MLPEDLRDKVKIRTFACSYDCVACKTVIVRMVDVAENLEQLVKGTTPPAPCPDCKAWLVATVSRDLVTRLRALPARDRDATLDKLIATARDVPAEKLENCLVARPESQAKPPEKTGRAMYVAMGLSVLLVGGMGVVAVGLWKQHGDPAPVVSTPTPVVTPPPKPAFTRPDWIMSDVPSSGYCHDMINR